MKHPDNFRRSSPTRPRRASRGVLAASLAVGIAALGSGYEPRPQARVVEAAVRPVEVTARGLRLRLAKDLALDIPRMRGEMVAAAARPPILDDPSSFVLRIASGEIEMGERTLTALLAGHVAAHPGARATGVGVSFAGRAATLTGRVDSEAGAPFAVRLRPRIADDGRLALAAQHGADKASGGPGLVELLGAGGEGITVTADAILVSLPRALPPPAIEGRASSVRISRGRLVLAYAEDAASRPDEPETPAGNYLQLRHGILQFGKLTMHGADLRLVDADPRDPFDFAPSEYQRQVAGARSQITEDYGLRLQVPDFGTLFGE